MFSNRSEISWDLIIREGKVVLGNGLGCTYPHIVYYYNINSAKTYTILLEAGKLCIFGPN